MVQGFLSRFIPFVKNLRGCTGLDVSDRVILLKVCCLLANPGRGFPFKAISMTFILTGGRVTWSKPRTMKY